MKTKDYVQELNGLTTEQLLNREKELKEQLFNLRFQTITVVIDTYKSAPIYGKRVKYSKKYYAHDANNEAHVGDTVQIMETRPLSAKKRFRLVKVVEKAVIL